MHNGRFILRKLVKTILVGCVLSGSLLFFFLFAAYYFFHTDYTRQMIQSEINKSIPGTIQWGKHKVSIFSGSIEMESLRLKDLDGKDVISVPHLFLKISWMDIPLGILTFEKAVFKNPEVQLYEDENGELNLIKSLVKNEESSEGTSVPGFPLNVKIENAVLQGGELQYHSSSDTRIILPKIEIEVQKADLLKQEAVLSIELSGGEIFLESIRSQLDSVRLKTRLFNNQLSPLSINLITKNGSRVKASGRITEVFDQFKPELEIEIDGEINDILRSFLLYDEVHGIVAVKGSIKGSLANPGIVIVARCLNGDVMGTRVDQAELFCHLDNGTVTIEKASLIMPFGSLNANGDMNVQKAFPRGFLSDFVDVDEIDYRFAGSFHPVRTRGQLSFLNGISGFFQSEFEINGKGFSSTRRFGTISLKSFIENLRKENILEISDTLLSAIIKYNKHHIIIPEFTISTGKNQLSGNGRVDSSSGEVEAVLFSTMSFPVTGISMQSIETLQGNLNLEATLSGKLEDMVVNGFLKGNDIQYQGVCIGNVSLDYLFSKGILSVDSAQIQNFQSELDLSGAIKILESNRLLEEPQIDAEIQGEKIFSEDFLPQLKGRYAVQGSISGDLIHPEGSAYITGQDIDFYGQKVKAVNMKMHADGQRIYIDKSRIAFPEGEEIQLDGWASLYQRRYDFQMFTKGISLNHIDRLSFRDWGKAQFNFAIKGTGSFENPACSGEIGFTSLQLNQDPLEPLVAKIDLADGKLSLQSVQNKAIEAEVNIRTKQLNAFAQFNEIKLEPWFVNAGIDGLSGSMGARLNISGSYHSLKEIIMRADFSDLKIFWEKNRLLHMGSLSVGLENGRLGIPDTRMFFIEDGFLDFRGKADFNGSIDAAFSGKLPAKMVELISEEISDVKGVFLVDASITGPWDQPRFRSDIEIQKVQGRLPYFSEKIREMDGFVIITPEMIRIKDIRGRFESGKVSLNGSIGLNNYPDLMMNLTLNGHSLPFYMPNLEALMNAELQLKGDQKRMELSGDLIILEGEYSRDVDLNPLNMVPGRSRKHEQEYERKTTASFLDRIELDIDIKNRNPFMIDNNIAIIALKPDIHIQGNLRQPVFTGRAVVESGVITYQGKSFEVTRGLIDFINPYEIEPRIELEGNTQIREWKIFLSITGVPENLKIILQSEPTLQDGDILSLLVFGKTVPEFVEGEEGQTSSPASILAGLLANQLQKNVKEETGLDSVEMEYQKSATDPNLSQVKVEVGKELSRQIMVKYGIETMNSKVVQKAITQYRFFENVMLEAYQDSEGDYGGELQYRLEFR
jgi:translocation and assembly module TamB